MTFMEGSFYMIKFTGFFSNLSNHGHLNLPVTLILLLCCSWANLTEDFQ